MSASTTTRRRGAMRAAAAIGAAVLVSTQIPTAAMAAPVAPQAVDTTSAVAVTGGSLTWGVRYSIRNYLENFGHTEGHVSAYAPAIYKRGDSGAVFPVVSGSIDAAAGTASLSFGGELEMFGFGESWLDFDDVRLEIADGEAELIVDLIESYNVKEPVDDFVLATYELSTDDLVFTDGVLTLTTGEGRFSNEAAVTHLPSYGGPTYAAPNDYTDALVLSLAIGDAENPGTDPGTDPGTPGTPGTDPAEGPYGLSIGAPLSGTTASIRVKPGYAIAADGSTTLTLEGIGFDPGKATVPGTGSGGIYVGVGTAADPTDLESWRRSKGGSSGPLGSGADFTYGAPIFVANHLSGDADVANGVMDADGNWTAEITLPGSSIASFFGGAIDCLEAQCAIFSFGAHGVINAQNEAYTAIHFDGQDTSGWPDRDLDDPTEVPPVTPTRPSAAPSSLPTDAALSSANAGAVEVRAVEGSVASVFAGASRVNTWVGAVVYSDPAFIDWYLVPANGLITVALPTGLPSGAHKLALLDAASGLVGWDSFTVAGSGGGTDTPKGDPWGSSTGTGATGATLTVTPAWSLADEKQTVDLKGTGYATSNKGSTFGGAYILFGWVDQDADGGWQPSAGGRTSVDYAYADGAGTFQSFVNYPGNSTEPGYPYIQADGSWEYDDFPIKGSTFSDVNGVLIDCYEQQCGVMTIGAHGQANAGVEVFTPVYFSDSEPENTAPTPVGNGGGVVANPNVAAGGGLSAATGLDAILATGDARTRIIAGVLLLSVGLFAAALVFTRARRRDDHSLRPVS